MIYLFLGFGFTVLSLLEIISNNRKVFKIIFFFLGAILILFSGLRDGANVGIDSPVYYRFYLEKNPPVEFGYKLINDFFSNMDFNYNVFLIFINMVIIYNISKFIRLNSYFLIFPLFIFFSDFYFYFNFSGIRQAIAMSFVALSVYYIFENKKIISFVLVLIASLFHVSALVFYLAFFVPKVKMVASKYFKFLLAITAGIFIGGYIVESIPYLNQKFLYYSSLQEQSDNIVSSYYIGIMKRSAVVLSVVLVYKNFFEDNKNFFLYNLYLIGLIIYIASYLVSPEFGVRLGSYFIVLDCILISRYIYVSRSLTNRLVLFAIFTLIALYKVYTYTQISAYDYKFFSL